MMLELVGINCHGNSEDDDEAGDGEDDDGEDDDGEDGDGEAVYGGSNYTDGDTFTACLNATLMCVGCTTYICQRHARFGTVNH